MPAPPYAESSSENGRQKSDVAKKANRHLPETGRQALWFLHLSITGFIPVFPEKNLFIRALHLFIRQVFSSEKSCPCFQASAENPFDPIS